MGSGLEPVRNPGKGAAAGGFVAGVQVAVGQIVVDFDAGCVGGETIALFDVSFFDFQGLGVASGAVGSLKALLGSPAALGGAQGGDGGVCGFETAALAAVAAAFALGGDGELFLVFALECEADDATLAVAPAAVFDAAFEFAFAAVDVADGYQLEAAALDVDPAGDAVVDIDGVLPGGGAGGKGAEKSGEEVFFHVGNFLVYGADCGRLAKVSA